MSLSLRMGGKKCLPFKIDWCDDKLSFALIVVDSDSDNFLSLKKASSSKQNGLPKPTKAAAQGARPGVKALAKSPIKPSTAQSKAPLKSPVTPKSAEPKKNPTSVVDYFGSGTIQRSDKKLVASVKRKAVSADDEPLSQSEHWVKLWIHRHKSTPTHRFPAFTMIETFIFTAPWFCQLFSSANSGFGRHAEWRANCSSAADGWRHGG